MNEAHVKAFLSALGGEVTHTNSKWVTCRCVFARWKHDGGVDNNPSSGMTVKPGGTSIYNCYTCGSKGPPYEIYREVLALANSTGFPLDKKRVLEVLTADEDAEFEDWPDYDEQYLAKPNILYPFSEEWYHNFPPAYNHPYVAYRGVDPELAERIDIRVDEYNNRILFPIRDWGGVLYGVHGRTFLEDVQPRYYSYPFEGHRNPDVWMGEHHVDLDKPVILVEGQFDYAAILPFYDNVLSGQTTQVQEQKLKRISVASEIITFFDLGTGGEKGREYIDTYFKGIPVTHLLPDEEAGDVGNMSPDRIFEVLSSLD